MIYALRRLLWIELFDLSRQPLVLIGVFLLPLYILSVSKSFVNTDTPVRTVLTSTDLDTCDEESLGTYSSRLANLTSVAPIASLGGTPIRESMAKHGASLGVVFSTGCKLSVFEQSVDAYSRRKHLSVALQIRETLGEQNFDYATALETLTANGGIELNLGHQAFYPSSEERLFIPRFLALIAALLSTLIATRSMLRDTSNGIIGLLVAAPGSGWTTLVASKVLFASFITLVCFSFLLLTLKLGFSFHVKPGLAGVFLSLALSTLSSATVGVCLALLGRGAVQTYLGVSIYFIATIILTGFLAPLGEFGQHGGSAFAPLFPITYLRPLMEGWLFFGDPVDWRLNDLAVLAMHLTASVAALSILVHRHRRQF